MEKALKLIKLCYTKRTLLRMRTLSSYMTALTILSIALLYTIYGETKITMSLIVLLSLTLVNLTLTVLIKLLENNIKELKLNYDKKR